MSTANPLRIDARINLNGEIGVVARQTIAEQATGARQKIPSFGT